jgi:hypothetical protein
MAMRKAHDGMRLFLILSTIALFVSCGGGGGSDSSKATDEGSKVYSDSSLKGVWIATAFSGSSYERPYLVADGNGGITDIGFFDAGVYLYEVAKDGKISVYDKDGSASDPMLSGSFDSDAKITLGFDDKTQMTLRKVDDLGICSGTWSGTVTKNENEVPITYIISFNVDSEGDITSLTVDGNETAVSGKMYSVNGYVSSFLKTDMEMPLDQFSIVGTTAINIISGKFIANQTDFIISITFTKT